MQQGGDWTDREIARFTKREAIFKQYGLSDNDAEKLAQQLLYRDRPEEFDDRRVCWECKHFNPLRCAVGQAAMPFILQRCPRFELRGQ